ncbi:MAG: hypothetical protein LBI10_01345 [Deltaproteobacteria bacterium]|jgi:hypothetical protein|nr:hypothetical protein [Deltaproteobacteria bacterium]
MTPRKFKGWPKKRVSPKQGLGPFPEPKDEYYFRKKKISYGRETSPFLKTANSEELKLEERKTRRLIYRENKFF